MAKKTPKSKYLPSHPEIVKMLIVDCGLVNNKGEIAWTKIAKALGVSTQCLTRWRTPSEDPVARKMYYKPEFAKAVKESKESIDAHEIKLGVIALAKPHKTFDTTRELKTVGPVPPPLSSLKGYLIEWADKVLDYEIDPAYTKTEVYRLIEMECFERTETKLVTTKEREREEVDMNAVKLVLANVGPDDERWVDKKEVNTDDKLTDEQCQRVIDQIKGNFECDER